MKSLIIVIKYDVVNENESFNYISKIFFPSYSNTPHEISFNTLKKEYSNKDTKIPNLNSALNK